MKFTKKYTEMTELEKANLEPLEALSPKLRVELGLDALETPKKEGSEDS